MKSGAADFGEDRFGGGGPHQRGGVGVVDLKVGLDRGDEVDFVAGKSAVSAGRSLGSIVGNIGRGIRLKTARLAPEAVPALRKAYMDDVASIADDIAGWQKAGADPEFIAREAWANRRALGIQYKDLTPADELARIHARNLEKYGDPLGPSIDWLRSRGRTWEQIIESATRPGGKDLGY